MIMLKIAPDDKEYRLERKETFAGKIIVFFFAIDVISLGFDGF